MRKVVTVYKSVSAMSTICHACEQYGTDRPLIVIPHVLKDIERVMGSWGSGSTSLIDPFIHIPAVGTFPGFLTDDNLMYHNADSCASKQQCDA